MGLIRKMPSISTLDGVKYTSKREAQIKAAHPQAKLARAETKLVKVRAEELAREHVNGILARHPPEAAADHCGTDAAAQGAGRKEQAES